MVNNVNFEIKCFLEFDTNKAKVMIVIATTVANMA